MIVRYCDRCGAPPTRATYAVSVKTKAGVEEPFDACTAHVCALVQDTEGETASIVLSTIGRHGEVTP